jgi:hypothetical protein
MQGLLGVPEASWPAPAAASKAAAQASSTEATASQRAAEARYMANTVPLPPPPHSRRHPCTEPPLPFPPFTRCSPPPYPHSVQGADAHHGRALETGKAVVVAVQAALAGGSNTDGLSWADALRSAGAEESTVTEAESGGDTWANKLPVSDEPEVGPPHLPAPN